MHPRIVTLSLLKLFIFLLINLGTNCTLLQRTQISDCSPYKIPMKKVVLKLDVHDEKCKQKAMKMASSVSGLDSISMDMKEKKLTLTGDIDPVALVSKLRKVYHTEIVSVGPAKEPEKKKDEPKKQVQEDNKKKDKPKKDEPKKQEPKGQAQVGELVTGYYTPSYYVHYQSYHPVSNHSVEENPNSCVIC